MITPVYGYVLFIFGATVAAASIALWALQRRKERARGKPGGKRRY
jgi:hypothetical protein